MDATDKKARKVLEKIHSKRKLTNKEELYYLTSIVGMPLQVALKLIAVPGKARAGIMVD